MKLQEIISEIFSSEEYQNLPKKEIKLLDQTLYGDELETFKDKILQSDEFSNCDELIIMKYPITKDTSGKTIQNKTYKLLENQKFKGKCYLLSLALTPEMFDPKSLYNPVLDNACITPTVYDPFTFEPKKKIVIEFSPEVAQDQSFYEITNPSIIEDVENNETQKLRKNLHETLDKILDNPESYQIKGERGVLVRGVFEEVSSYNGIEKTDLFPLNTEEQTHAIVYFFEEDKDNSKEGQINLKLSSIPIPFNLKDKFMEELGPKSINVTRQEIEEFLEQNK